MAYEIIFDDDFHIWLDDQPEGLQDKVLERTWLLREFGPALGRPHVDTIKGSDFPNMKELRIQYMKEPWRVLFAFDPKRQAIFLLGGNKCGDKHWYEKNIPVADMRLRRHLQEVDNADNRKGVH